MIGVETHVAITAPSANAPDKNITFLNLNTIIQRIHTNVLQTKL